MKYRFISDFSLDVCQMIILGETGISIWKSINGFIGKTYGCNFELKHIGNPSIVRYSPPTFKADLSYYKGKTTIEGEFTSGSRAFELIASIWFLTLGGLGFIGALADTFFEIQTVQGGNPKSMFIMYPIMVAVCIWFPKHVEKLRMKEKEETIKFIKVKLCAEFQEEWIYLI